MFHGGFMSTFQDFLESYVQKAKDQITYRIAQSAKGIA
jgi:hypothetical protein